MTRKPGRFRPGNSVLLLISTLMIASAGIRFGVAAAPALARGGDLVGETLRPENMPGDAGPHTAGAQTPDDLQLVLSALQDREKQLDTREREIEDRYRALAVADAAVSAKLKSLVDAEEKLRATLALADGAAEGDLTRLTDVYQQMKPKDSAALFEQMEPRFAAGFLSRMRPETAAGILAGMNPQSAYAISVVLAGRNAGVPTE